MGAVQLPETLRSEQPYHVAVWEEEEIQPPGAVYYCGGVI